MAGELTYLHSDGKSVKVDLLYPVSAGQVAVVDGWLGIIEVGGASGDNVAMNVDGREYQFTVPAALAVSKGQIVYVDAADTTNHIPDDSAWYTSAGAGRIAFFKATSAKTAENVVIGKMLGQLLS